MSRLNYVVCTQTQARTSAFQERFLIKKISRQNKIMQAEVNRFCIIKINRLTPCLQGSLFSHLLIFSKSVIFLKKLFKDNHIK